MLDGWLSVLILVTALACGLIAGVFYAFSSFVMKALGERPVPEGIAAMQAINRTVLNPWFLLPFFGIGVACLLLVLVAVLRWSVAGSAALVAGGLLYLLGTLLVTMRCNVPLNRALAATDPASEAGSRLWSRYLSRWTAWNHLRTVAALAAAAVLLSALL